MDENYNPMETKVKLRGFSPPIVPSSDTYAMIHNRGTI